MTAIAERPIAAVEPAFDALNLPTAYPEPEMEAEAPAKDLLIIDYSGDLEKAWAGNAPALRLRPSAQAAQAGQAVAPRQDRVQQDLLAHGAQGPRLTRLVRLSSASASTRDRVPGRGTRL